MASLNALFDLSRNALSAEQLALTVTANNVANQNVKGYVRQVVDFTQADTVRLGPGTSTSRGVLASASSKRDLVLERRVEQQAQAAASTSAQAGISAQVQSVFGISGSSASAGSTALGASLDAFFSSLTALESNPADATTRQGVLNAAGGLAASFRSASASLSDVRQTAGAQLNSATGQVNALTATIARLNLAIGTQSPNGDAGVLEDQRQSAIASLSGLIGLDQVKTEANGITLTTTGGTVLVAGGQAYGLSTTQNATTTAVTDAQGHDVSATITGGSLGGLLAALTTDLPAAQTGLDALGYRVATVVNAQNGAGLDSSGAPGGALFTISSSASGAAAAIAVSATSPSAVAAAAAGEGATGNGNANALAALANDATGGSTISGQLATLLGQVGSTGSTLSTQQTVQAASLAQLTSQRDSLSAVSLDEEAASLQQFQRSYQAAAKLFQVIDSLLAASINLGQSTTVA